MPQSCGKSPTATEGVGLKVPLLVAIWWVGRKSARLSPEIEALGFRSY